MQKFSEIKYARPDIAAYKRALEEYAEKLKNAESWDAFKALWLEKTELAKEIMTMRSVASIRNTVNTADAFYDGEMRYFNAKMPAASLCERKLERVLLESRFVSDFEREFGSILIATMRNSARFADERISPFQVRIGDLVRRYVVCSSGASTEFRGEKCNFYGLLKAMQSPDRALRREAFEAWSALYASIAPELDQIYDEMIAARSEMAETLGFKSYTDMAYLERRRFDYTPADVKKFRDGVKKVITPACVRLFEKQRERIGVDKLHWYDESLVFQNGNADPEGDRDALVQKALEMYRELSPETGEFFEFMVQYDLFDLETKPGKRAGGYCTSLPKWKAPFIFSNFNGTAADVGVLTHEAGHAFENYIASRRMPLPETSFSTSEINEIHSMSMEHFTYPWMDRFFGEKTNMYLYDHLWGALNVIPYMCCVDEFQHRVYDERLNAAERRAVWRELEREYMPWRDYDESEFLSGGGFWMQKQHIFLYPFYYIEYALAQMCAFQFYLRMEENRAAAWADYLNLCRAGGSRGYFELLKLAKLDNPFNAETVETITNAVARKIDEMEKKL